MLYRPALLGQAKRPFRAGRDRRRCVAGCCAALADRRRRCRPTRGPRPRSCEEARRSWRSQPEARRQVRRAARRAVAAQAIQRAGDRAQGPSLSQPQAASFGSAPALKQTSTPDESEADFRVRLSQRGREQRDAQVEKLRQKYAPKIAALQERIRKAQIKVEKEKSQANQQTMTAVLSIGASILGAMFGRKLASTANVTRAASSMRQAGRIARERQDISDAAEGVEVLQQQLADLKAQFEAETEKLQAGLSPDSAGAGRSADPAQEVRHHRRSRSASSGCPGSCAWMGRSSRGRELGLPQAIRPKSAATGTW